MVLFIYLLVQNWMQQGLRELQLHCTYNQVCFPYYVLSNLSLPPHRTLPPRSPRYQARHPSQKVQPQAPAVFLHLAPDSQQIHWLIISVSPLICAVFQISMSFHQLTAISGELFTKTLFPPKAANTSFCFKCVITDQMGDQTTRKKNPSYKAKYQYGLWFMNLASDCLFL